MPTLRDYPLYPYLAYRQLSQDLSQVSPDQINAFTEAYPTLPPARSLRARYINELANCQDWYRLLVFSPQPPKPVAARCNFYYAKWAAGKPQEAWDGACDIWLNSHSLPDSCNKLFGAWDQAGERSPLATLERIWLAMNEIPAWLITCRNSCLPHTRPWGMRWRRYRVTR